MSKFLAKGLDLSDLDWTGGGSQRKGRSSWRWWTRASCWARCCTGRPSRAPRWDGPDGRAAERMRQYLSVRVPAAQPAGAARAAPLPGRGGRARRGRGARQGPHLSPSRRCVRWVGAVPGPSPNGLFRPPPPARRQVGVVRGRGAHAGRGVRAAGSGRAGCFAHGANDKRLFAGFSVPTRMAPWLLVRVASWFDHSLKWVAKTYGKWYSFDNGRVRPLVTWFAWPARMKARFVRCSMCWKSSRATWRTPYAPWDTRWLKTDMSKTYDQICDWTGLFLFMAKCTFLYIISQFFTCTKLCLVFLILCLYKEKYHPRSVTYERVQLNVKFEKL